MPSKFGTEHTVPEGFPDVLRGFMREALRSQPDNLWKFGAHYFTELQQQQNAEASGGGAPRLSPAELLELLSQMFAEADVDHSGALNHAELKTVLANADLGLTKRESMALLSEADMDGNGEVSYEEFVPLAVDLVQAMYARMDAQQAKADDEDQARRDAKDYLVHGMKKDEVENIMGEIFKRSDADGSGSLSIAEFQKCCRDADIGLTRKEVNILMHQCDVDGDGTISYDEFVPLCFEMLVEIMKDEILAEKKPPSELEIFLKSLFQAADSAGEGRLGPTQMLSVVYHADLGLSRLQTHAVLSEGEYDEDGMCDYAKFAPTAAELICRMLDVDAQIERNAAIAALSGSDLVHGMSKSEVENLLFKEFDDATGGKGTCALAQVKAILTQSALGVSPTEMNALLAACAMDGNGEVMYAELCTYAFPVLQYLAQNAAIA